MIWPPVKAWTSKVVIHGHVHFVAINHSGELVKKWVIMMAVLDSRVIVKVFWSQLVESSNWETGWNEINYVKSSKLVKNKSDLKTIDSFYPSLDSGLTVPISKNNIRPWFDGN